MDMGYIFFGCHWLKYVEKYTSDAVDFLPASSGCTIQSMHESLRLIASTPTYPFKLALKMHPGRYFSALDTYTVLLPEHSVICV